MMASISRGVLDAPRSRGTTVFGDSNEASISRERTGCAAFAGHDGLLETSVRRALSSYAVRATGFRPRGRPGCTASGPCRSASSIGRISAAGFGGLNR